MPSKHKIAGSSPAGRIKLFMSKRFIVLGLVVILFLTPALSLAGVYQACNIDPDTKACVAGTEKNVYYDGLVPCGKEVIIGAQLDKNGDPIHDADGNVQGDQEAEIPCQFCHLLAMVNNIIKFTLVEIVPLLAVAMFVVAGLMFFTARGVPTRLQQAKKLFESIVIGLIIIYSAWLVVTFLMGIIGVAKWTGLRGGWYKINCPIQLPESALPSPSTTPPTSPTSPTSPTPSAPPSAP